MVRRAYPRFLVLRILALIGLIFSTGFAPSQPIPQPRFAAAQARVQLARRALNLDRQAVAELLGIPRPKGSSPTEFSLQVAEYVQARGLPAGPAAVDEPAAPLTGLPEYLDGASAMSAVLATTLGGRDSQFDEVALLADLDGREDLIADHGREVNDLSAMALEDWMLTRVALSAHTAATGYTQTVYYYGDSVGNVYVAIDTNDSDSTGATLEDEVLVLNLPTLLNAFGTLSSDDQIVITGLAVNPVADLTSYFNVNGAYSPFNNQIGEILYVTFWDTGGGLRLAANNEVVHSGLLAFPISDVFSPAKNPPAVQSNAGFPVTVGGSFGVAFSVFDNLAGVAVDDDGSIYFQQVDLINLTGANIVKITDTGLNQDRSAAVNSFPTISTLNPAGGVYGTFGGPSSQNNFFTNFSGTSNTFGNIAALATGPDNSLYAALAASRSDAGGTEFQATQGLFAAPAALSATPSMIINFADVTGAFDTCSTLTTTISGAIPIADGFADVAQAGLALDPGVNNFRAFVIGNGPDLRGGGLVGTTPANTLKLDFQIDYSIHAGLAVDEAHTAYVISGGTPAGVGRNPSPERGEILVFPDHAPRDRRADFVDLRGDTLPRQPAGTNEAGDGDSDRADHLFWRAPIDQVTAAPTGLAGLNRGFLLYLNRRRNNPAVFTTLPSGSPQADDGSNGPVIFEHFDPGHQVAGGKDSSTPFTGDDSDGAGWPALTAPREGGFEFTFGLTPAITTTAQNGFFLNANGSVSFGSGIADGTPTSGELLAEAARVAPAWLNLNPASRATMSNTFPVQALGFAGINHFKVRWINVPELGQEGCASRNTFSVSLFDDGTGYDENENLATDISRRGGNNIDPFDQQEGPTDLRYDNAVGQPVRPASSGQICYDYGRMDALGTAGRPVVSGFSTGGVPTVAETDLSEAALAAALIGSAGQGAIFEIFTAGVEPTLGSAGAPELDLRAEGNDTTQSKPAGQPDPNRERVCFYGTTSAETPTITLQSSLNPAPHGHSITFTATVAASAGITPTGQIVFRDGGALLGTATLSSTGPGTAQAVLTVSTLTPGTHAITAEFGGSGDLLASISSAVSQEVRVTIFLPLAGR